MKKKTDNGTAFPLTIAGGIVVGGLWTIVAGTLWQWVPISMAIAGYYGVSKIMENETTNKPKSKKRGDKCC